MKFPKERVTINAKIKEHLKNQEYFEILKLKDEIFENLESLDEYSIETLIMVAFHLGDFDQVIIIYSELFKRGMESFAISYYGFLAMLANTDIFQAVSYIKKSELLNQNAIKEYFLSDGANYSNILFLGKVDAYGPLALVLVNFINGISKEVVGNVEIDSEYILFRFFDLINMLYEIGYPDEIISKLTKALKIIFNLEV